MIRSKEWGQEDKGDKGDKKKNNHALCLIFRCYREDNMGE